MSTEFALQALLDAKDPAALAVTDDLLKQILAVEQDNAFSDDDDVPLRAIDAIIERHVRTDDLT
jgi:hypothetical protein